MSAQKKLPLCIDLDGTLIRSDVTQESVLLFIKKYPWKIFHILFWLYKGRAYLKAKLAEYVMINPDVLPYNKVFLDYLREKAKEGHDLYLVTAADEKCAKEVYEHLKIFKDYLASDGYKNLRASTKAQALCALFGEEHFIYAGNSRHDLPVWAKSAEIIAVNTPKKVIEKAKSFHKKILDFKDKPLTTKNILKDLMRYAWGRYYLSFSLPIIVFGSLFYKMRQGVFNFYDVLIFSISLILLSIAVVLLGLLFQLEILRIDPKTKRTLLATGRLTIVNVMHLMIAFAILGIILIRY